MSFTVKDIEIGVKNAFAEVLNRNSIPVHAGRCFEPRHSFSKLEMIDAEKRRVLFMCEEQFNIELPQSAKACGTVKSVIDAVTKCVKSSGQLQEDEVPAEA